MDDTVKVTKTIAFLLASMAIAILIRDYKQAVRSIEFNRVETHRAEQQIATIKLERAEKARLEAAQKAQAEKERIERERREAEAKAASEIVEMPAVVRRPTTTGVEQWRSLAQKYFGSETDYALAIMKCESGGNPNASSPTNDHGLMQINWPSHYDKVNNLNELYDPSINMRVAKQIRDGSGWSAWTCSRKI